MHEDGNKKIIKLQILVFGWKHYIVWFLNKLLYGDIGTKTIICHSEHQEIIGPFCFGAINDVRHALYICRQTQKEQI